MGLLAIVRIRLMYLCAYLLRICLPFKDASPIAVTILPFLHPRLKSQKPAFLSGLSKHSSHSEGAEQSWQRHKALVGMNRFASSYYAQPDMSWLLQLPLEIKGEEHLRALHDLNKGVLVMTYHHHLNMLFCNMLARIGLPVTTIAMDDRDKSRPGRSMDRVTRIHTHAATMVNGGELLLIKTKQGVRPILRAFEKNHLVISANDFPEVYDDKNRKDFPFLDTTLSCPTGTVKLAVKKQIPIVAAYLNWLGEDRFELIIAPVSDGSEELKVKEAMSSYLGVLENMVQKQSGIWEGWKWLSK